MQHVPLLEVWAQGERRGSDEVGLAGSIRVSLESWTKDVSLEWQLKAKSRANKRLDVARIWG